jgi:hypothetical protein
MKRASDNATFARLLRCASYPKFSNARYKEYLLIFSSRARFLLSLTSDFFCGILSGRLKVSLSSFQTNNLNQWRCAMSERNERRDGREPSPLSYYQGGEFLGKLQSAGLTIELAQKVVEGKENWLGRQLVDLIDASGIGQVMQSEASEIMGKNFISSLESDSFFLPASEMLSRDPEDPDSLFFVPYPGALLKKCRETHILFSSPSISIAEMRNKFSLCRFSERLISGGVEENGDFIKFKLPRRWYLMRKTIAEGSKGPTPMCPADNSRNIFGKFERLPHAAEVICASLLWWCIKEENLFVSPFSVTSNCWSEKIESNRRQTVDHPIFIKRVSDGGIEMAIYAEDEKILRDSGATFGAYSVREPFRY